MTPGRRRRTATVVWLGILSPVLAACASPHGSFDAHGVRFDYPKDWRPLVGGVTAQTVVGEPVWRAVLGVDRADLVIVSTYRLNVPVDEGNFPENRDRLVAEWMDAVASSGGHIEGIPSTTSLGGLPALRFEATGMSPNGSPVLSTVVVAFQGLTEYFVNCQRTPARAELIERGCEQILQTFRVG